MKIWVDADACPVAIKEILFRAAQRTQTETVLVANRSLRIPRTPFVKMLQVSSGFDVADNEIINRIQNGDLLISSDLPLAAAAIEKGARALSPRGELFSPETINAKLGMRDFMDTMRASGIHTGGPPALGQSERNAFANQLDRFLTKHKK